MRTTTDSENSGEIIGLLQPYLDGELSPEEAASVERRMNEDASLRDLVHEQLEVREALQSLAREPAPQSLRARILLDLDAVDHELAESLETPTEPESRGLLIRLAPRLRSLARGAAVMLPASAAAIGLFFLVQRPLAPTAETETSQTAVVAAATSAQANNAAGAGEDGLDLKDVSSVQVPLANNGATRSASGIHLVGLEVPEAQPAPTRRGWTARAMYQDGRTGSQIIDLQQRARGVKPTGTRRMYRGRTFFVSNDGAGRPVVQFVADGTLHQLSYTPSTLHHPGPAILLELGHELAAVAPRSR